MKTLKQRRDAWKARRLELALGQLAVGQDSSIDPRRDGQGAAMRRLTRAESHSEWKGD